MKLPLYLKTKLMMKNSLLILISLFGVALAISSCGTDEGKEEESSASEMILGKWMYEAMEVNGANIFENMDFSIYIDFQSDNSFVRDVAEVTETGTWKFKNDSTLIIVPDYGDQTEQELLIEELSEEKLVYSIGNDALESRVVLTRFDEEE